MFMATRMLNLMSSESFVMPSLCVQISCVHKWTTPAMPTLSVPMTPTLVSFVSVRRAMLEME